ncbi:hypothetical protein Poli38472_000991 [Pythium oligandrum]|uniref:Uncharacterized protein n=1 Tax=Pythium oligandrum TaxID=41045 RepID=A0A8K1CDB1_PYTOL|nr:hypothetical protein Poli38472_000991 [Pythium oligandrum]|eukprot:TMW60949.1 hypothetical protein Poli38472_000991 [Pythium oligandrum]
MAPTTEILSDSDAENAMPTRPKLRTRRTTAVADQVDEASEDEDDIEMEIAPVTRRTRRAVDEAFAPPADDEDDDDEDDESTAYEESNHRRRRSTRQRKTARDEIDEEEDDVEFELVVPKKVTQRAPGKRVTTNKPRKRPRSTISKPRKTTRAVESEEENGEDEDTDVDEDWLLPVEDTPAVNSDSEDENAFIIDKILAREVHTLKEWRRIRINRTTRFLNNASIFIDDDDEEEDASKKMTTAPDEAVDATEDTTERAENEGGTSDSKTDDEVVVIDESRDADEEERFLVKWKKLSYIHVSWELEKSLLEVDKNAKGKIQRFREKESFDLLSDRMHGDEYFSPEFRDVDRILDIQDRPGDAFSAAMEDENESKLKYFLVKWKSLPYEDITWEREDDIQDDAAVKEYYQRLERATMRYNRMAAGKSAGKTRKIKFRGYSATNKPPFKDSQSFELRDYQLTGVNWMLFNWYQGRNSMLADEMGLGKTVQTVTYVNHLAMVEELPGPYLIIAPLSTLGHWQREFTNWTNLNAVVYHGSANGRKILQDYEFFLSEEEYTRGLGATKKTSLPRLKNSACYRFDVLITTYEMCSASGLSKLANVKWQLVVVDEAHRLKNRNSKLSVILRDRFSYQNILLLTGTPLQNNVEELWTLLNFLDPEKFGSMDEFMAKYGELKDSSQVEQLHSELRPFLLRRMKEDVEKSLAPKEEIIVEVELTVLQKQYYRAIYEQNTEFLARGMRKAHAPSLMNVLMELRKCCNHPFLIRGMEQREIARLQQQKDVPKDEVANQVSELLVTASGKLILLDKLLPPLREKGHRVLIFSQFKIMLDILQDYLKLRSYRCERIDGNITGNDRQAAIDRFCDPASSAFVMLLSTRAGGVGINLTAADTVIIYDSDWNPQNDLQAQARCHRIGQKNTVKIYRLLTAKTYELQMFHQASLKLGLDQAVLGSIRDTGAGTAKKPSANMSREEIENLLKHGAYEMFKEDKDGEAEAASKRFSEESIDQILSRSTKIVHDPKAGGSEGDGKKSLMSSFSKATFVSSTNPDEQLALDDPDFWTKVIGLQAVPDKPVEPSPLRKRRCRRQVKSYLQGGDSGDDEEDGLRKRRRKSVKDADNDEFVVLSSESSTSDDGEDDLADDEFVKNAKRSKRIPIRLFHSRLVDTLLTFGYDRWDVMRSRIPQLHEYSELEIQQYCHTYLVDLVHVASFPFFKMKLQHRESAFLKTNANLNEMPMVTVEELALWLNTFAGRFHFIRRMVSRMGVPSFATIRTMKLPPVSEFSVRSDRDASNKLAQIDRMYTLSYLVEKQFSPVQPMLVLLGHLQAIDDSKQIRDLIQKRQLPPALEKHGNKPASTEEEKSSRSVSNVEANAVETANGLLTENEGSILPQIPDVVDPKDGAMGDDQTDASKSDAPKTTSSDLHDFEEALKQLDMVPDVGDPSAIAPWWISIVDDVMLLILMQERIHKWRYFLDDAFLDLRKFPLSAFIAEAEILERACRHRIGESNPLTQGDPLMSAERSILDGYPRGSWSLSSIQARRLLHRIELFRLLRSKILLIATKKLVEIMNRVIFHLRNQEPSIIYPDWWNSPRHDILLLQGVECFGLDEFVSRTWQLPPFASVESESFPSDAWVENYVMKLAHSCDKYLARLQRRRDAKSRHHSTPSVESEAKQRVRDISGMRMEDPHIVPAIRRRSVADRMEYEAAMKARAEAAHSAREASVDESQPKKSPYFKPRELMKSLEEVRLMKKEDPYYSEQVRRHWLDQIQQDQRAASEIRRMEGEMDSPEIIEINEVDDEEEEAVAPTASTNEDDKASDQPSPPSAEEVTNLAPSEVNSASPRSQTSTEESSKPPQPLPQPTEAEAPSSGQKRKRMPRAWEVIVIDDSEDEEIESRTTRNRRRTLGRDLTDGL